MQRQLLFKYLAFDSVLLEKGKLEYSMFQETGEEHESVTAMTEAAAVEWFMSNPVFRDMFIREFFSDPGRVKTYMGLKEPFTRHHFKPGDIDLLLVDPANPGLSVAFEFKRVKAISESKTISKVNNAQKIRDGVIQANFLRELGFHRHYLVIILLEDGRQMNMPNQMFNYSRAAEIEQIYEIPMNEALHQDVGVIYIKVNQTTGKRIDFGGGLGFCIDKEAVKMEQLHSITGHILERLKQ